MVNDRMSDIKQMMHSMEYIRRKRQGIDLFPLDPLGGARGAISEILEPVTWRTLLEDHSRRGGSRGDTPARIHPRH